MRGMLALSAAAIALPPGTPICACCRSSDLSTLLVASALATITPASSKISLTNRLGRGTHGRGGGVHALRSKANQDRWARGARTRLCRERRWAHWPVAHAWTTARGPPKGKADGPQTSEVQSASSAARARGRRRSRGCALTPM
eukprot:scaffold3721_cov134-Isochrysis_galbana.AAC.4